MEVLGTINKVVGGIGEKVYYKRYPSVRTRQHGVGRERKGKLREGSVERKEGQRGERNASARSGFLGVVGHLDMILMVLPGPFTRRPPNPWTLDLPTSLSSRRIEEIVRFLESLGGDVHSKMDHVLVNISMIGRYPLDRVLAWVRDNSRSPYVPGTEPLTAIR